MDGKVGIKYSPTYNNESLDDIFNDIRDSTKVFVDTHWDCVCKIWTVCGCGCDPKHDGWRFACLFIVSADGGLIYDTIDLHHILERRSSVRFAL